MAHLEVKTSQGIRRLRLGGTAITVGRLSDNTLVVNDDLTSRHHCVIEPWEGGFRVRDLGSRNGTKLNDHRISAEALDNGDVLHIGSAELRFIDPEQQVPRKRRNTPDFTAALDDPPPDLDQVTLDHLDEAVTDVQTSYEKRLREIIDGALDKPFDETQISL
ncbi:MAG: FHA domain-containing protein, partial [Alphaproteobacteria bacterium]